MVFPDSETKDFNNDVDCKPFGQAFGIVHKALFLYFIHNILNKVCQS